MNKSPWKTVRLEKVAEIQTGISKSASRKLTDPIEVPYLRVANVQDGHLDLSVIKHISIERKNLERYTLKTGDVLLTEGGDFDKLGRGTVWNNEIESCVHQNHVFSVRTDASVLLPEFLSILTASSYGKRYFISCSKQSTNLASINSTQLKQFPVLLPSLDVQKSIVSASKLWDNAIERTEALIAAKEKQFEWLTSNLINRDGHKRTSASGLMTEVSKRNKNSTIERVLSVTNHSGFVLPEEQFERRVASANVSNYKVVEQGQYAYNPSRINVGSIARLDDWENGILSPMYVVFKLDTKKVCSDYFLHWLNSSEARQRIKNSAQGSVRETVSFKDLGAIDIPLPAMDVQKDVTYKLNLAQKEISLLKKTLEQYRSQKRGLMQKLLTGEWQVSSSQPVAENMYQEASA
ncbi:restriction endonuclease subunit S [Marinomonas ostreistagni]|uniref:Restriction endonuclease subunit S n=1 Tax=Marinomonas ostreistagni TaxID=359209 RepID=A0ABS0ZBZ0_9GAMM|nr:restriction endonuclease subunit S [Marinomonas ostreistagni]MBJ7551150.1 restriction endonuclease subunit S [Marinomonas ostreistagni]